MDLSAQNFTNFRVEEMELDMKADLQLIQEFTNKHNLCFDKCSVDYTIALFDELDNVVGTGSFSRSTLKYVLVAEEHRESNAFAQITTHLINKVLETKSHIFVYTRPELIHHFEGIGFRLVAKALPLFSMLEFGVQSVSDYVDYLKSIKSKGQHEKVASVVVNCNPFTKGHLHLIEKAASENDILYVIVVEEDLSVFPFQTRWHLIKEGTKHLKNIIMVKGSHYIVSGATFPCYFLKSSSSDCIIENQAELDIQIFRQYIIDTLGITSRYVGTEPNCNTTAAYNKAMHKILPEYGVNVVEIDRITNKNLVISASQVRKAIKDNRFDDIAENLPECTRDFLLSDEAKPIIEKIKKSDKRH